LAGYLGHVGTAVQLLKLGERNMSVKKNPTPVKPATRDFLVYLHRNSEVRDKIRALPGKTLLYAGGTLKASIWPGEVVWKPIWQEIKEWKKTHPEYSDKQILHDVLSQVPVPGIPVAGRSFSNLLQYVKYLEEEAKVPEKPDLFTVWRCLSGIFAANARGAVSFAIGDGVKAGRKIFATNEIHVLERNPNIDAQSRSLLEYYVDCVKNKKADIHFGFIAAGKD